MAHKSAVMANREEYMRLHKAAGLFSVEVFDRCEDCGCVLTHENRADRPVHVCLSCSDKRPKPYLGTP